MLLFATTPDIIFTEILTGALEISKDEIRNHPAEDFNGIYGLPSNLFSQQLMLKLVRELQEYHRDPNLWQLTDYHYLLLYWILKSHIDMINDDSTIFEVKGYDIHEIDFDDLIGCYFFDTDFLISEKTIVKLRPEIKKQMGLTPEIFGIATSMPPHPDELKIVLREKGNFEPVMPIGKRFKSYPLLIDEEKR